MASEAEYDEIVMTLVEAALALPQGEREAYLRKVCRDDRLLYEDAAQRIAWEERMGGFLSAPLLKLQDAGAEPVVQKLALAPWLAAGLVVLVALLAASFIWSGKKDPTVGLAAEAAGQLLKFDNGEGRQWLDAAGATLAKAKAIDARAVGILILAGDYQLRYGFPDLAAKEYELALQVDPSNAVAKGRLEKLSKK